MSGVGGELAKVLALAEKATAGEWVVVPRTEEFSIPDVATIEGCWPEDHFYAREPKYWTVATTNRMRDNWEADTALIAAAVNFIRTHGPTIAALEARALGAERDAERYRWLRSQGTKASTIDRLLYETISDDCNPPYRAMKHGADLDAAIDAATKETP